MNFASSPLFQRFYRADQLQPTYVRSRSPLERLWPPDNSSTPCYLCI